MTRLRRQHPGLNSNTGPAFSDLCTGHQPEFKRRGRLYLLSGAKTVTFPPNGRPSPPVQDRRAPFLHPSLALIPCENPGEAGSQGGGGGGSRSTGPSATAAGSGKMP